MQDVTLISAFMAGVASFLSPCVLPLIPVYISLLTGSSIEEFTTQNKSAKVRLYINSVGFLLGLLTVFMLMGLTMTAFANIIFSNKELLRKVSGAVIILLGLFHIGLLNFSFLKRNIGFRYKSKGVSFLNSYVLGLAFSFGWTPCVSAFLGTIVSMAMIQGVMSTGMLMLIVYSVGFSVPFLLSTFFIEKVLALLSKTSYYAKVFKYVTGVLIILMGYLVYSNQLNKIASFFG